VFFNDGSPGTLVTFEQLYEFVVTLPAT